ncbi:MAG TPA: peptidoglycan editing factor PgeF [Candidatus Saccharimonadia bacterium]|nr:peptidoglycan editing factor PgeF [Candidatus Saccharimonadia bacterium]
MTDAERVPSASPALHAEPLRAIGIVAFTTLRRGCGVSTGPYSTFNLASHVGDDAIAVAENRSRLVREFALPSNPVFVRQVHGVDVWQCDHQDLPEHADAVMTTRRGNPVAVMTADCLPIVIAARDASAVACVHAGWRGLADGVIREAVDSLPVSRLVAWIGPAISAESYEVGDDVRDRFAQAAFDSNAFTRRDSGRWSCDLTQLAREALARLGVTEVWAVERCTFREADAFFSHRRDGATGRMATVAWIV